MKYECNNCGEVVDESNIIMSNVRSGFGGGWLVPYCEDCYKKLRQEK